MDKDAVQKIQETAHIPEILAHISSVVEAPAAALPDDFQVVDLERYMDNATRYRLNYKTPSINDFLDYGRTHAIPGACCFVDPDAMAAKCVFDLGTLEAPGHKEHVATLGLKKTAAFKALMGVNGEAQSQRDAAEFVEDWAHNLTVFTSAGDTLTPAQAAKALCDLTIDQARSLNSAVGDFSESMSVMEKVEARSKELLPAAMEFRCEPYLGLAEHTLRLRVSMLTSGEKPRLVFRVLRLEEACESMAEEFKEFLLDGFTDTGVSTFIGSV